MQGMAVELSREDCDDYLRHNERYAATVADDWDAVIVHDPQPAAMRSFLEEHRARWVWRSHVDSSAPHPPVWEFLRPYVQRYDTAAFTLEEFIPPDLPVPTALLVPAIDPLTPKNRQLPAYLARETAAELGIALARPLRPVGAEGEKTLGELLEVETAAPEEQIETRLRGEAVHDAPALLSEVERDVVRLRYGLNSDEPHTVNEVARRLGLTRQQVAEIESEALSQLAMMREVEALREAA